MFRPSHVRRVQKVLEDALPSPYEAQVRLEEGRTKLRVVIMDPDEQDLPVAQTVWEYDPVAIALGKLPRDDELEAIASRLSTVCAEYPTRKAAEAVEKAERQERRRANAEARAADAEDRAKAEQRLKSAAAKLLGADEITEEDLRTLRRAVDNPALG